MVRSCFHHANWNLTGHPLLSMKSLELMDAPRVKHITVLLADDHARFRKSLRYLVELDGEIEVVGEAKNGREAVSLCASLHPEVIIMDIAMPLLNGLLATEQIMAHSPTTRVLILSAHPDPEYIQIAITLGASGYLMKQSSTQFVTHAIREALKGKCYFSASIAKPLRDQCEQLFGKGELQKKKATQQARARATSSPPALN